MKLTRFNQLMEEGQTLEGHWELDEHHEVYYRSKGDREEVKLKASLLQAEPEALILLVTQRKEKHRITTSLLKLSGAWRLDDRNRIVFYVEREFGKKDVLTFQGAWQVGKQHEIIYTYERQSLKTKTKELNSLIFKGVWDISERHRLSFTVGVNSQSVFRFRGAFQTKSILAKQGEIRYQVGVEVLGKRRLRTITLFGKWKLSGDLELSFEIEYRDGTKHAMVFGAEFSLGRGRTIETKLMNKEGDPLGLEVIFTQEFMDGEAGLFLRLRKSLEESALEAGIKIPW